jgi:hypothetical protein
MIEGKDHPERIPDLTAYRLYLITLAKPSTATEAEKRGQAAHLRRMGLSDPDNQALVTVMASFRERYMKLIEDFNKQAEAANAKGQNIDHVQLLRDRDTLVQTTRDTLKSVLTPDGFGRMDSHIRAEKRAMTITVEEALP